MTAPEAVATASAKLQALEAALNAVVRGKADVVRHPLVQRIIAAYEEHRGRQRSSR